jgi:hypothetical protein
MAKKLQAHDGLSLLLQQEGAPNTMIMDGAKEQVMGTFQRKCREAGIWVNNTNRTPHGPMPRAEEGCRSTYGLLKSSQEIMGQLSRAGSLRSLPDPR